jgi:hypothetical protein
MTGETNVGGVSNRYLILRKLKYIIIIIMIITCDNCNMKKGRKKKMCEIHSFVMKNLVPAVKFKTKTNINFCPILNK